MRNAGILTIYSLTNTSAVGAMPIEKLVKVTDAFYEERTIGITRMYAAMGADQQIDMLVRCFHTPTLPTNAEYAILEDGLQYRITLKQKINADTFDLTLVRLENNYDVQASTS